MRLRPVYVARFTYPKAKGVKLTGKNGIEEERYYSAEGTCEGEIVGNFWGVNHPHRRTDETFLLNMQGVIETNDSATILLDYQGYGRSRARSTGPEAVPLAGAAAGHRQQVVGFAKHVTENEKYRWLNDTVCAVAGEVRIPAGISPEQVKPTDLKLVFSVAEMVWEPPPE